MDLFNINLFQMKTRPENRESAGDFLQHGYVRIGWSKVPDMTFMDKEDIRSGLAEHYGYEGRSLSTNLGTLNTFAKVMKKDDVVLISTDGFVHIGVVGDYVAEEVDAGRWCHKRSCNWIEMIHKDGLTDEVNSLLRNMTTVTKFPQPFITSGIPEIIGWADEVEPEPVPLKDNQGMLWEELDRLGAKALTIMKEEMESEDPERRRKAAVGLLSVVSGKKSSVEE